MSGIGSPPRARGEVLSQLKPLLFTRITPACAGRSGVRYVCKLDNWDHPRVRGEKVVQYGLKAHWIGSPPRARGEAKRNWAIGLLFGITPACAGRRTTACKKALYRRDHPRVRGEKTMALLLLACREGSPPRARGEAFRDMLPLSCPGITPACAGRRPVECSGKSTGKDHPRVRGEK